MNRFSELLFDGVRQDLRDRYSGSVFGIAWAILFPAAQLCIFAVLYAVIFKIRVPGLDTSGYILLIFSGLVPLMAFNEALGAAMSSIEQKKSLLNSTSYPIELIPIRSAVAAQIPGVVGLLITAALAIALDRVAWQGIFFIPILWILLLLLASGLGSILALVTLVSKDIVLGFGLIAMLLVVSSPFAYTPDMVPEGLKFILWFNPLSYFVMAFQQVLCFGKPPDLILLAVTAVLGAGGFTVFFKLFQRVKRTFFDYA